MPLVVVMEVYVQLVCESVTFTHIHNLLCFLLSFNSPSSTSDHAMCSLPAHLQVVVKFLRKASILPDGWVEDEEMGVVPREIALLARITHPHIVEVRTQWRYTML